MDFDFEEAQNAFRNLQANQKLPPKIEDKLRLLEDSINCYTYLDISEYTQLDENECASLMKLNKEAQEGMFIQIVKGFAVNSFIPSVIDLIIQGEIDIRTQHLRNWDTKKFKIDVKQKSFEILRNMKKTLNKGKKPRIIELPYYSVQALEFKYNRHRFVLQATVDGHGYYKTLVCGSVDKQLYTRIMDALKTITQFKDYTLKGSIFLPTNPQFASIVEEKRKSIQPLIKTQILTQKDDDDEDEGINQPVDQKQSKKIIIRKTPQQSQSEIVRTDYVDQQKSKSLNENNDQFQAQSSKSPISIVNPPLPVIEEQLDKIEDYPQNVPVLFQGFIDDGKLASDYFETTQKQFTQISISNGIQILKSQTKHLCYRVVLTVNSTDIERVFQSLAEIDFIKKWNSVVNPQESKFLNLIGTEKSGIIYQRHKPYGYLYLPRDFVFLRFVFSRNGELVIIDKSIEHEEAPQYLRVIRGDINYQLISICKQENEIQIKLELEVTNGGLSSTGQDGAMTQQYLEQLKNLNQFIKTYSQTPLIHSPLLSCLETQAQIVDNSQNIKEIQEANNLEQSKIEDIPTVYNQTEELQQQQKSKLNKNQEQEINEVQQYNQEIKEEILDQTQYVPSDFCTNTLPVLPDEEVEKVKKLIKSVEDNDFEYRCLKQRYVMEPIQTKEEFIEQIDGGHYFLRQDWKRDKKNGGMIFYNSKKIQAQKRVIKFMLKSIGSNLIQGKSILNISLPVEIFEIRSNLERFAYSFTFAPKFLEQAAKLETSAEQMKYTLAFGLSSIIMYMSLEKPFNPILGETYQGMIHGCPVYAEQISHHPPVSAFLMKGKGYEIDGHLEATASMHANSVTGKNLGYIRVTYYNTGAKHLFIQCPGSLSGTAFGTRVFNIAGRGWTIDMENMIIADLTFNPGKNSYFGKKDTLQDQFVGGIFKVKPSTIARYKKEGYLKFTGIDFNKDIDEKLSEVSGIWNENIVIDGEKLLDIYTMYPYKMVNHPNPLPSDANYRLDILYWKLQDFDNSQKNKEILEVIQRNDRKWREKINGKKQH